jgi:chromatin modification-related protein EAF6
MTENAPPGAATSGDSSRGMPYYEKLRRDLRETLQKKRTLDASIVCRRTELSNNSIKALQIV